jgi:hypothetical protein
VLFRSLTGGWLTSDLSYLKLWPWWMRDALLAVVSAWNVAGLLSAGGGAWLFVSVLLRRSHRIVLDAKGVSLVRGGSQRAFPWADTFICSEHLFAIRIGSGREGFWVLRVLDRFRDMQEQILARAQQARSDSEAGGAAG